VDPFAGTLPDIIEDGIREKEMKPIMPYVAMLTILSSVRGLEFWHRSGKKVSPQEIEDNMVNHLINGLSINTPLEKKKK
jgi:hypothetical protein